MLDEQLEFAISQYADGTLPPGKRAALEAQLNGDPALMALLDEYRQLGSALRMTPPLPTVDWDRLAVHLSNSVAQGDVLGDVLGDVHDEPVRIYAMPWVRRVAALAVAACLAIAIGIGLDHRAKPPTAAVGPAQLAVAGPVAEAPTGAVVEQISIGPSPAIAMDDSTWRYSESGVVAQPQRVVIATSDAPAQDTTATPY
jgi:negative regulator of sigma E activity